MKTPDPEIFIRAAERVEEFGHYACVAIDITVKREASGFSWQAIWFQSVMLDHQKQFFTSPSHRVFALLLAAEIAKEGGL